MNRKQFITLVVLGLVIGGLGIYLYNRQKESYGSSYFESGQRVIPDFPLNEVAHLRVQTASNEVNLVRGEGNIWVVRERWNYPANFAEVSGFLRDIWELEPVQDVQAGPSQYGRLNLLPPDKGEDGAGTLVEFKDAKGTNLKSIVLGKNLTRDSGGGPMGGGSFPVGRYILVPGTEKVWLVNETFSSIQTDPQQWLDKGFIKVEKIKSVALDRPGSETNSWTVTRETEGGEWKLADPKPGENFDPSKASSLNYALSSPSFNDVVSPEAAPEQTGLDEPITAKIETFDGFTYNVNIGSETNDNYFVNVDVQATLQEERAAAPDETPEDKESRDKTHQENVEKLREKLSNEQRHEKWTYLVSKWTMDSLLKDRGEFMAEPATSDETEDHSGHDHATEAAPRSQAAPAKPPLEIFPPELRTIPATPLSNIPPDAGESEEPLEADEPAEAEETSPAEEEPSSNE